MKSLLVYLCIVPLLRSTEGFILPVIRKLVPYHPMCPPQCPLPRASQSISYIRTPQPSLQVAYASTTPLDPGEAHFLKAFRQLEIIYGWCFSIDDLTFLENVRNRLKPVYSYLSHRDLLKIDFALQVSYHAHLGQKRRSGEPFVIHPIAVAAILGKLRMDANTICAGLLHDTVEDTYLTLADIENVFGPSVKRLVEGETKVSKLPKRLGRGFVEHPLTDRQVENLCHLLMAMAQDWRVLVIKLADRLHNVNTIEFMPQHKQERIARETLDVFVPLADKLGVWDIKTDLEDISFKILHSKEHAALQYAIKSRKDLLNNLWTNRFGGTRMTMGQALTEVLPSILKSKQSLQVHDIRIRVQEKQPYHVFKQDPKLLDVDRQPDLIALKVIVASEVLNEESSSSKTRDLEADRALCYRVLEALHAILPSVGPQHFRDFVRFPKDNGYQALHSVVKVPGFPHPVEVHVSTDWMNEVARNGLLALWTRSKRQSGPNGEPAIPLELPWLQRISAFTNSVVEEEPSVTASSLIGSLQDQLRVKRLVLTSAGEVLSLEAPPGGVCTARDAALVGMEMMGEDNLLVGKQQPMQVVGAQVNGHAVPLSKQLESGDVVDIITRPYRGQKPASAASSSTRSQYAQYQLSPTAALRSTVNVWPWCLIGSDDPFLTSSPTKLTPTVVAAAKTNDRMWGARLKRKVRGQIKLQEGRGKNEKVWDSGEVKWLKETELRHGRMSLCVIAYWWLGPLVMDMVASSSSSSSAGVEGLDPTTSMMAALMLISNKWNPSWPSLQSVDAIQLVTLIGIGEVILSILPETKRFNEMRRRRLFNEASAWESRSKEDMEEEDEQDEDEEGQLDRDTNVVRRGGRSSNDARTTALLRLYPGGGVSVAATNSLMSVFSYLRQSELSLGRVGMLCVLSILLQGMMAKILVSV